MKWRQNHFDVITILRIWRQIKIIEIEGEMALEIVTSGKNDKTEKNC